MTTTTESLTRDAIYNALLGADTNVLLLSITECTQDTTYLEKYGRWISDPVDLVDDFPEEAKAELASIGAELFATGAFDRLPAALDDELLTSLSEAAALRPVSHPERQLILKEMDLLPEAKVTWGDAGTSAGAHDYTVIIVGAGFSGLALAIQLKNLGIPFKIYERDSTIGGTWATNTYPGCAVDILSHYYSYSFFTKPDWNRYYSLQEEVLTYIDDVVDHFGLSPYIHLNCSVDRAQFDTNEQIWRLKGTGPAGEDFDDQATFLVTAVGALSTPHVPALPGLDLYKGEILHSAAWDDSVDLTGKRVALVGNGASGNQIGPRIVDEVEHLTVITRSHQWVTRAPKYGEEIDHREKTVLGTIRPYARWYRIRSMLAMNDVNRPNAFIEPKCAVQGKVSRNNEELRQRLTDYLSSELGDRQDLLPRLLPDFPPVMKRMIRDNGWPRMFRRDDVTLVDSRASSADERGLIDGDGHHHEVDVVIFATGFKVARMLGSIDIQGPSGTLREMWGEDDPRAFLGMSVPEFPNLFIMYGPNTNIGWGGSIVAQGEAQSFHIARIIRDTVACNGRKVSVLPAAYENYNRELDIELSSVVWSLPVGSTWYRNSKGRVVTNMPWTSLDYWNRCFSTGLEAYRVE